MIHCFAHSIYSLMVWWMNIWKHSPHDIGHNIYDIFLICSQNLGSLCRLSPRVGFFVHDATCQSPNSELRECTSQCVSDSDTFPNSWTFLTEGLDSSPQHHFLQWQSLRSLLMCPQGHKIQFVKSFHAAKWKHIRDILGWHYRHTVSGK